jgi:hypothetical protein
MTNKQNTAPQELAGVTGTVSKENISIESTVSNSAKNCKQDKITVNSENPSGIEEIIDSNQAVTIVSNDFHKTQQNYVVYAVPSEQNKWEGKGESATKADFENYLTRSGSWVPTEGMMTDVSNHIASGKPFMTSLPDVVKTKSEQSISTRRCKQNCNVAYLLAFDVDNCIQRKVKTPEPTATPVYETYKRTKEQGYMSMQDMKNNKFFKQFGGIIHPTTSHTDEWHRYRVIFALETPITNEGNGKVNDGGNELIEICHKYLAAQFTYEDVSTHDGKKHKATIFDTIPLTGAAPWYGSDKKAYYINENNRLPEKFIVCAREWWETNKPKKPEKQVITERSECENQIDYLLAQRALAHIPQRKSVPNTYTSDYKALCGLYYHFGYDIAFELAEEWMPTGWYYSDHGTKDYWNNAEKLKSLNPNHPNPFKFASLLFEAEKWSDGEFNVKNEYRAVLKELGIDTYAEVKQLPDYLSESDKEDIVNNSDDDFEANVFESCASVTESPQTNTAESAKTIEIDKDNVLDIFNAKKDDIEPEDEYGIFHPVYAEALRKKAEYNEMNGASFVNAGAIAPLMAGLSHLTKVKDSKNSGRTAYPTTMAIGDTSAGKSEITTKIVSLANAFLTELNGEILQTTYTLVKEKMPELPKYDVALEKQILSIITLTKKNDYSEIEQIKPFMLDNTSSSKQGADMAIGNLAKGIKLRRLVHSWFNYCYEHPIYQSLDESSTYLNKLFSGKSESHEYSVADFNEGKTLTKLDVGDKHLRSGTISIAKLPRTMNVSIQFGWLKTFLEKNKAVSDGFPGRWMYSALTSPGGTYQVKVDDVDLASVEQELKFLVLGSTIINYLLSLKLNNRERPYRDIFQIPKSTEHTIFKKCCEDIETLKNEIINEFPDWANLTKDIAAKTNHIVYELSPHLKRFNWGIELFLKRLETIYGKRELSEYFCLLDDIASGDLINFAKVIATEPPKGCKFYHTDNLDIECILKPVMVDKDGERFHFTPENDLSLMAEDCKSIEKVDTQLNDHDVYLGSLMAINSLKSYRLCLLEFQKIDSRGKTEEYKANKVRALDILMKSNSDDGIELKVSKIMGALQNKIFTKEKNQNITFNSLKEKSSVVVKTLFSDKSGKTFLLKLMAVLVTVDILVEVKPGESWNWKTKKFISSDEQDKIIEIMKSEA